MGLLNLTLRGQVKVKVKGGAWRGFEGRRRGVRGGGLGLGLGLGAFYDFVCIVYILCISGLVRREEHF